MADKTNASRLAAELQRIISEADKAGRSGDGNAARAAQELRLFLTTGAYPTSRSAQASLDRLLMQTLWEGKPGVFFQELQREYDNQQQASKQEKLADRASADAGREAPVTGRQLLPPGSVGDYALSLVGGAQGGGRDDRAGATQASGGGGGAARGGGRDERATAEQASGDGGLPPGAAPGAPVVPGVPGVPGAPGVVPKTAPLPGLPTFTGGAGLATNKPAELAAQQGAGGYNATQASIIASPADAEQKELRLMALARDLGLDYTRLSPVGRATMRLIAEGVDAFGPALPFANGGNGMGVDATGVAPQIQAWAKSFGQAGANPFAQVRNAASAATANPAFMQIVAGMGDARDQMAALNNMLGARAYGLNPMVQTSLADQSARAQAGYRLSDFDNTGTGKTSLLFDQWLATQPASVRALYGLR